MKITDIKFQVTSFSLIEPIKVAFGCITDFETILLRMETDEGIIGYGEASPFAYVTGDTIATALAIGEDLKKLLIGQDPLCIEKLHRVMDGYCAENSAIKAGIDIAAYDIAAKKMGVPLYKYLGGCSNTVDSDATIGIAEPAEMARIAKDWVAKKFDVLKIKLGQDVHEDVRRIAAIRAAVGDKIALRIDANQGWTVKEAIFAAQELAKYGVELIEQPIVHWNIEGLQEITRAVDMPIYADESCHGPVDAARLARTHAVDGMNIKLMKCGGLFGATGINTIAEANGLSCMIGCMGESRVANIAGMHFAAAHNNVKIVDLDTVFSIRCDWITGGFTSEGNHVVLTDEPGLGITVEGF